LEYAEQRKKALSKKVLYDIHQKINQNSKDENLGLVVEEIKELLFQVDQEEIQIENFKLKIESLKE
jgi:hypothetical protein